MKPENARYLLDRLQMGIDSLIRAEEGLAYAEHEAESPLIQDTRERIVIALGSLTSVSELLGLWASK